jgi:hypothetical protein
MTDVTHGLVLIREAESAIARCTQFLWDKEVSYEHTDDRRQDQSSVTRLRGW